MTHCPPPRPARCPSNESPPRGTCVGGTLAAPEGTLPRLAPHRTRTGRPCPPSPPATATEEHGSLRRGGTEGALRHPRHHTVERASISPPGTPPGR